MEINEYLIKLIQTTKDMENLELFPQAASLSRTEFRLIREVVMEKEKGKDIISSELARRLGITRSAVSQLVTKLEGRDIVKRVPSSTDKKIAYVRLSDSALVLFERQCEQANEIFALVIEKFGADRIKKIISEYEELAKVFQDIAKKNGAAE